MFQRLVVFIRQLATCQFCLADAQQELGFLTQALGGVLALLSGQLVTLQHVGSGIEQTDSLTPELDVRLHIARNDRIGGTTTATLGTHGLFGIEDGIVFQFCPRSKSGIQRLLLPFRSQHEIWIALTGVVDCLQRIHPTVADGLLPVNLLHALLHPGECTDKAIPLLGFLQLVEEDTLGRGYPHRCHHVKSLG